MNNNKCVILVPYNPHIETACEKGLRELELRGYTVWRIGGYSAIDRGRSQMASDALRARFDELFWIDSDMDFKADDVDRLRSHNAPFISGLYAKKGPRAITSHAVAGTKEIVFGPKGGVIELHYAATGFLLTHRRVYEDIRRHCKLPICNRKFNEDIVPYFLPLIINQDTDPWYLSEDFSFSHRAREAGHKILADTTIRLGHIGRYSYQWEDAGSEVKRYANYNFHLNGHSPQGGSASPAQRS